MVPLLLRLFTDFFLSTFLTVLFSVYLSPRCHLSCIGWTSTLKFHYIVNSLILLLQFFFNPSKRIQNRFNNYDFFCISHEKFSVRTKPYNAVEILKSSSANTFPLFVSCKMIWVEFLKFHRINFNMLTSFNNNIPRHYRANGIVYYAPIYRPMYILTELFSFERWKI